MKNLRRTICMLLALAMLLTVVPAYASEEFDGDFFDDYLQVVIVRVADPVIGENPAPSAELSAIPAEAITADSVPIVWESYDEGTGTYAPLADGAVFEDGGMYRAVPDTEAVMAAIKSGYTVEYASFLVNETDLDVNGGAVFGPLGSIAVGRIEITIDEPVVDGVPATTAKVACDVEGALKSDTLTVPGWQMVNIINDPNDPTGGIQGLSAAYVSRFLKGGYYRPDFTANIKDVLADGYAINPVNVQYAVNGDADFESFGPVGFEKITALDLKMKEPVGGDATDLPGYDPATDDWYWVDQTGTAEFEDPADQHVKFYKAYPEDAYSFWYEDKTYSAPFIGTFKCGDPYFADVNLAAAYGYYFAPSLSVTVNGKTSVEFVPSGDPFAEIEFTDTYVLCSDTFLIVRTSGTVGHNWGERTLTGKEGDDEIYTTTCKACGEKKTEKLPSFKDVAKDAFYAEAVQWAVVNNITNGTGKGTFSPNNKCTRGQVVTFLWRAAGSPEPTITANPFTDVKTDGFYYKAMLWAVENEVTSGLTATTFGPGKECTRGQVVAFLWRAKGQPAPANTTHPFTDVKSSGFYFNAMLWAVEQGVTNGTTATTFGPGKTCTRGQVVTFLYRAFK